MAKVIEGWRCRVLGSVRCVDNGQPAPLGASLRPDGRFSCDDVDIPPAVLEWLVRPMLHDAWLRGNTDKYFGQKRNPYADEPGEEPTRG